MKKIRTHYDNLKVARNAPIEVIRAAYKALLFQYHPDRNPNDDNAVRILSIINSAYKVLSDPKQRADHDRWIEQQEMNSSNHGSDHSEEHERLRKQNNTFKQWESETENQNFSAGVSKSQSEHSGLVSDEIIEFDFYGIKLFFSTSGLKKLKEMAVNDSYESAMYALGVHFGVGDQAAYDKAYEKLCLKTCELLLTKPKLINSMLADGHKLEDTIKNISIEASLNYMIKVKSLPLLKFSFLPSHDIFIEYFEQKSYVGGLIKTKGELLNTVMFNTSDVVSYIFGSKRLLAVSSG